MESKVDRPAFLSLFEESVKRPCIKEQLKSDVTVSDVSYILKRFQTDCPYSLAPLHTLLHAATCLVDPFPVRADISLQYQNFPQ